MHLLILLAMLMASPAQKHPTETVQVQSSGTTAMQLQDGPPLVFHIHGETWFLMQVETLPDFDLGRMNCEARLIRFIPRPKKELADTIWHELLHAFTCRKGEADDTRFNNSNDPKDGWEGHKGTYDLAHELTEFTANNPALIHYLEEAGK